MKAIDFVKKYGLDLVKRDVACLESGFITKKDFFDHYGFEILDELKQIVEAHELVEKFGGLEDAKDEYFNCVQNNEPSSHISKAIELVEACQ